MRQPLLIILGGLPGTGKTTLAKDLTEKLRAVYLRIDTIEQALLRHKALHTGAEGYLVAYELAEENLRFGNIVIADCVNSIEITRKAWRDVAKRANVQKLEIEVICSDQIEHKRRVEERAADIEGHVVPTWEDVLKVEFAPWVGRDMLIDTAAKSIEMNVDSILSRI